MVLMPVHRIVFMLQQFGKKTLLISLGGGACFGEEIGTGVERMGYRGLGERTWVS
jgi:hypothetical protein